MGNSNTKNNPNKIIYEHTFMNMDDLDIEEIKKYKIIETKKLDKFIINKIMITDNYFDIYPTKSKIINNMLNYCLEHEDKEVFKKTDYICNKRIKVCICNTQAEEFRKLSKDYVKDKQYISWCKKL